MQTTIQYLAVRLRHDLSWVRNACSEDRRAGDGGRHERTMKSEAAWCKVIASCCRRRSSHAARDGSPAELARTDLTSGCGQKVLRRELSEVVPEEASWSHTVYEGQARFFVGLALVDTGCFDA